VENFISKSHGIFSHKISLMKKLILLAALFLMMTSLKAQFKKGQRMAGATIGNIYYNSGKTDYTDANIPGTYTSNNNNFGIGFNPNFGWFISDNTAVGTLLNLSYRHQNVFDESNGSTFRKTESGFFNFGIGGFVRNYFSSGKTWLPFGQFSLNIGIASSTTEGFLFSGSDKSTFDGKSSGDFFANAGLSAGFTKMLSATTGFEIFAGYNYSYNKTSFETTSKVDIGNNGSIDQTTVSAPEGKYSNHGFTAGIGFQIFLDPKKK
jgi:hypothetical protein